MRLIDLPPEILIHLPDYLDSLSDLYSLIQTSRALYITCAGSNAKLRPKFAKKYGQNLFPPHPHCLLVGVARQIADWAVQNTENRCLLTRAITEGLEDQERLLELGVQIARLSLNDVRAIHKAKVDVIDPLTNILDLECGQGKYDRRKDKDEGDSIDWSVCEDVNEALYNYLIYCELFHHSIDQALAPSMEVKPLDTSIRHDWISRAMSQAVHHKPLSYLHLTRSERFLNPSQMPTMLLGKSREEITWSSAERLDLTLKESVFCKVMEHQGLDTLRILLASSLDPVKDLVLDIRKKVDALAEDEIRTTPKYASDVDSGYTVNGGFYSMTQDVQGYLGWPQA